MKTYKVKITVDISEKNTSMQSFYGDCATLTATKTVTVNSFTEIGTLLENVDKLTA